jgi:hypothetical protein
MQDGISLATVCARLYLGSVKKKAEQKPGDRPFLMEVPKPVNQMTEAELDAFADEILVALEGKGSDI